MIKEFRFNINKIKFKIKKKKFSKIPDYEARLVPQEQNSHQ